ncbi:MAG: nodulation protein NfeD [Candidatus Krumholzibacteriia bacterium]
MNTIPASGRLACAAALLLAGAAAAAPVHVLTWEGAITPVAASYLTDGLTTAAAESAAAVVIRLDTPGGLDTSMREIMKGQLAAPLPVVVWVGPSGSRAASAGAFLTVAAHVAAMAPGTNIGSASPVQMGGAGMDSTMARKVGNDAAAYIASVAEQRGRDPETCRLFVSVALNLTEEEALSRGVIDFVAADLPAVLDSLRGRAVAVDTGTVTLPADLEAEFRDPSLRQRLLKMLADPNVAYILMMLGIYGLFFELSNPGAFAPGVLGGICLLLALFAFQALPIDASGVLLILLGVVLLILEVKVTSYGVLSIGGVAALVLGSLLLFDSSSAPWARLSLRVLVPTVTVFAGFFLLCAWLAVRGQRRPVVTGKAAMVGETGRVLAAVGGPGAAGKVVVHGEVWDATAAEALAEGAQVVVLEVRGRMVRVARADQAPAAEPRSV